MKWLLIILLISGCIRAKVEEPVVVPAPVSVPAKKPTIIKPSAKPEAYESLSSRFRKTEL